ncbi:MAG: hypothetical protein U9O96_06580 [Candidatus Thermoplasmatota archaeon]|nr:hypothetical protein [Candidatus Thermoplasmatota archaeon]
MNQILPEAESIKSLNKAGEIIAFLFGAMYLLYFVEGTILGDMGRLHILFFWSSMIFFIESAAVFAIAIGLIKINRTIDEWEYRKAKKNQFIWVVISFILGIITFNLGAIVVGIITVIAYKKYGDLSAFE